MYIDTSCLGAYYVEEVHTQTVQRILINDTDPVLSSLTEVEFHSLLNKKRRMHQINREQQDKIIQKFNEHLRANLFEILPVTDSVFHSARWVLSKTTFPLRTLDSLHLAFALTNRQTIFSTDKVLLDAAKDLELHTVSGI